MRSNFIWNRDWVSAEELSKPAPAAAKVKAEAKGAPAPAAAKAVTPKVQAPAAANVTSTEAPAPAAAEVVATEAPAPAEAQPAASTSPISPLVAECLQEEPAAGAAEVTEAIDAAIAIDVDQLMASGTADATVVCKAVAASGSELDAVQCVSSLDQVPPVPAMLFSRGGGADSNATLAAALGGKALNLCTYRQCQEVKMSGGAKKFCFLHNRLHDNTRNDFKDQGQIKEFNCLNKKKDAQELWNAMDLKAEAKLLAHGETTLVDPSAPQRGKPTGRMDVVQFLASVSLTSGLDDVVQAPSPRQYGIEKLVDHIPDFPPF